MTQDEEPDYPPWKIALYGVIAAVWLYVMILVLFILIGA